MSRVSTRLERGGGGIHRKYLVDGVAVAFQHCFNSDGELVCDIYPVGPQYVKKASEIRIYKTDFQRYDEERIKNFLSQFLEEPLLTKIYRHVKKDLKTLSTQPS